MRYLAEAISHDKIAVWFISDEDTGKLKDGIYYLYGQVKYPIFPNPSIFEAKVGSERHFDIIDCNEMIAFYKSFRNTSPPFEYTCAPEFKCSCDQMVKLRQALEKGTEITLHKHDLTEEIKENIIKTFKSCSFNRYHCISKELILGTI